MPVANITAEAVYGYVGGKSATYSTARGTATEEGTTSVFVGQAEEVSVSNYAVYRGYLKFDLSSLPAGANISAATLSLAVQTDNSAADFNVNIVKYDWSAQEPLAAGNRDAAFDGALAATIDVVWRNTSGMSADTVYTSPALDPTWLTAGENAYYALTSSEDTGNSPPSANTNEFVLFRDPEDATAELRPILNVTYTVLGGTATISGAMTAVLSANQYPVFASNVPKTTFRSND